MFAKQKMIAGALVTVAAVALGIGMTPAPSANSIKQDPVARGKYLVTAIGCSDCHTPLLMGPNGPEPDMRRFLSGHPEHLQMPPAPKLGKGPWVWTAAGTNTAFAGPWGVSYAANLTPDQLTGLGIWTEDQFVKTIRTGRHWGVARPILPPMPWQAFRNLSDDDLRSIYSFLRTVKPVKNQVPDAIVAPPPASSRG